MRGRAIAAGVAAARLLPVAVALAGCAGAVAGVGQRGDPAVERRLARRAVVAKEPPRTLVAEDASRCDVSEARFAEAEVGDRVWCAWQGGAAPRGSVAAGR